MGQTDTRVQDTRGAAERRRRLHALADALEAEVSELVRKYAAVAADVLHELGENDSNAIRSEYVSYGGAELLRAVADDGSLASRYWCGLCQLVERSGVEVESVDSSVGDTIVWVKHPEHGSIALHIGGAEFVSLLVDGSMFGVIAERLAKAISDARAGLGGVGGQQPYTGEDNG